MGKTPKRLRQKPWNPLRPGFSEVLHPEWLDPPVPGGFWEDPHNQKRYVAWLAKQLKINKCQDWYQVNLKIVKQHRGLGLLWHYDGSFIQAITTLLPHHEWHIWKFNYVTKNFWTDPENLLAYLRWFEQELGMKKPEDWYQVSHLDFRKNYGKLALMKCDERVIEAVENFRRNRSVT